MSTVLVTGAGRGFGRALFDVFHRRGWTLFPLVRNPDVAFHLKKIGGDRCHPIVGDVASEEVEDRIREVLEQHALSLDLLINNAGNIRKTPGVLAMSAAEMEEHFRVHCLGVLHCTRAALPFLKAAASPLVINITSRKGSISLVSQDPLNRAYAYKIAKCAQNMLTVCLDMELRGSGIRVLPVHPGRLKTEVAPPDADTPPEEAAVRLADWVATVDRETDCLYHDLLGNCTIPW